MRCSQSRNLTLYAGIADDCIIWILPNSTVHTNVITAAAVQRIGAVSLDGVVTIPVNLGGMRELVTAVVAHEDDCEWDLMLGDYWILRHSAHSDLYARRFYFEDHRTSFIHHLRQKE